MKRGVFAIVIAILVFLSSGLILISQETTSESPVEVDEALIERGAYLIEIGGCISCHTPYKAEYNVDPTTLTPEQLQTIGLSAYGALDRENRLLAGGRPFDLGPGGIVVSRNLTPDEETGLGTWTDEEIEVALRIGVSKDGTRLHPVMPYRNFYNMSREDMQSIIAYLRTVPAVSNEVVRNWPSGEGSLPELLPEGQLLEVAPPASDAEVLGSYLVNTIMSCGDCHTPLDTTTGAPLMEQMLAGGQPYEGPWGIIYSANITPHESTGIGEWTDEDIKRAVTSGVRIDGRRLILMPWEDYAPIKQDDLTALVTYLREGVTPIENEIPVPAINDLFSQHVEIASAQPVNAPVEAAEDNMILLAVGVAAVAAVVLLVAGILFMRRSKSTDIPK